jgi:hypothetical protein
MGEFGLLVGLTKLGQSTSAKMASRPSHNYRPEAGRL